MVRNFSALLASFFCVCLASPSPAQWRQVNGHGGATVRCLASGPTGIFAGTNGGVIHSTDSGITWSTINDGLTDSDIVSLIEVGSNVIVGSYGGSLYLLNDSGTRWHRVATLDRYIRFAMVGPLLFAIGGRGLAFSSDKGATWELHDGVFGNIDPQAIASVSAVLFVGAAHGIFSSVDFGATWQKLSDTVLLNADVLSMVAQGHTLFAATAYNGTSDTAFGGIFRSTDYGDSWSRVYDDLSTQVFDFSAYGTEMYAATNRGVLCSTDSGLTWKIRNAGLSNKNVQAVAKSDGVLIAGMLWDGIFRSTDSGANWEAENLGLVGTSPYKLCRTPRALFATSIPTTGIPTGLVESSDEGETWRSNNPDSINNVQAFAALDGRMFAATQNASGFSGIFSATDTTAWKFWSNMDSQFYNITFDTLGSTIVLGTQDGGVFLSRDTGLTWVTADSGLGLSPTVSHIAVIGDTLFAGTYHGAFRSVDTGKVWTQMTNGLPDSSLLCFAVLRKNLFAGDDGGRGVFRSTNNGESWFSASNGIPDHFVIVSLAVSDSNLFAGGYDYNGAGGRVFLTRDLGNSWQDVSIPGYGIVESLATDSAYLFATLDYGTNSSTGVWRRSLSEMISSSAVAAVPPKPYEVWNYPNPFSESTTITFASERSGNATVSILNLLGEEVARIYSGMLGPGRHSIPWKKPASLPPGAYECRIELNGKVLTVPIMLTR